MTKEQLLAFIAWLKTKGFYIAGPGFNHLLGTSSLMELYPDDVSGMLDDFLNETKGT